MKIKKYVIITASDEKYGDFLVNHWLRSLESNVNLKNIDVVVLDYGLNKKQREKLEELRVRLIKCNKNGHVVNIRYGDIFNLLKKNPYKQIMICDSGDIIFQTDINGLFERDKLRFRAVCEETSYAGDNMIHYTILNGAFKTEMAKKIESVLNGKKPINGGLIIGPRKKIIELCCNINNFVLNKNMYGPDQVIMNYTLYKDDFKELDRKFNYTLFGSKITFSIKKGVFFEGGEKIPIVHNSGGKQFFRIVTNFGYGPECNKMKWVSYYSFRAFYKVINLNLFLRVLRKGLNR